MPATVSRLVLAVLIGVGLPPALTYADQPSTIPKIGLLTFPPLQELLRDGLRERGYVEGKNIVIDWRPGSTNDEEMQAQATALIRSKVDVIVTFGTPATRAALAATKAIPIVFSAGDPVATGFAVSLAKPGGNATGLSALTTELISKRLELLHQVAPRARHVAYLMNSSNPAGPLQLKEVQKAVRALGVQLITLEARNAAELDTALQSLSRSGADSLLVTADVMLQANKSKIARAVRQARLPTMVPYRNYLDAGILMSYGPNLKDLTLRVAGYVDKILKGAKPADLPIEQVSNYELIIDQRVARELGIKVPQELLYRADEVIR